MQYDEDDTVNLLRLKHFNHIKRFKVAEQPHFEVKTPNQKNDLNLKTYLGKPNAFKLSKFFFRHTCIPILNNGTTSLESVEKVESGKLILSQDDATRALHGFVPYSEDMRTRYLLYLESCINKTKYTDSRIEEFFKTAMFYGNQLSGFTVESNTVPELKTAPLNLKKSKSQRSTSKLNFNSQFCFAFKVRRNIAEELIPVEKEVLSYDTINFDVIRPNQDLFDQLFNNSNEKDIIHESEPILFSLKQASRHMVETNTKEMKNSTNFKKRRVYRNSSDKIY
eukprot:NODE_3_length_80033_cov_0.932970.p29 type:complete len:280 gc:universal NODE_3_length_80033_cov_0.932970:20549-21388(+)